MKRTISLVGILAALSASVGEVKTVYVNKNAVGDVHDAASWATAFLTVQAGLDAADAEDEVWVAASTPAAPAYVKSIRITQPGIALYGGFAGTETHRDQRDRTAHPAVINGNKNDVVSTDFDMSLDGFVIRNGGTGVVLGFVGGRSTARNNVIEDNGAGISSNGIYVSAHDNVIRNNAGFAVSLVFASATITENQIYQNGGRVAGHPFIQLSLIRNRICGNGSGVSLSSASTGFIENNAICDNSGYGIDIFNSTARIVNNTLAGNAGHGISVGADGDLDLYNNVVAYNGGFRRKARGTWTRNRDS